MRKTIRISERKDRYRSWKGRKNDILKPTSVRQMLHTTLSFGNKSVSDTCNPIKNIVKKSPHIIQKTLQTEYFISFVIFVQVFLSLGNLSAGCNSQSAVCKRLLLRLLQKIAVSNSSPSFSSERFDLRMPETDYSRGTVQASDCKRKAWVHSVLCFSYMRSEAWAVCIPTSKRSVLSDLILLSSQIIITPLILRSERKFADKFLYT